MKKGKYQEGGGQSVQFLFTVYEPEEDREGPVWSGSVSESQAEIIGAIAMMQFKQNIWQSNRKV